MSERRLRRRNRFLGGGFGRGAKPPSEFSWGEASEGGEVPLRLMIAVVDYGRGNLGSVEKAFGRLGMAAVVTEDPSVVADAEAVVLPGDGAFQDAMDNLGRARPSRSAPRLPRRRPALPRHLPGLPAPVHRERGVRPVQGARRDPGAVRRFPAGLKIPHMGWNQVEHRGDLALFDGIPSGAHFYFVHSYYPATPTPRWRRHVHVRRVVSRGDRPRRALRDPVPSREEPALGASAARELRRLRAGTPLVTFQIIPAVDIKEGRCVGCARAGRRRDRFRGGSGGHGPALGG